MPFDELFHQHLIFSNVKCETAYQLFEKVGSRLYKENYVKSSYLSALTKREETYPTGLSLENINIAIPHTDCEHISSPFIAYASSEQPLLVGSMGEKNKTIQVSHYFFLGITESKTQVELLQYLMTLFTNYQFVQGLKHAKSEEEVFQVIKHPIRSEVL
ncbi:PTS sugar transporter subunit IIA [Alteribacillus sp. YIM 98480]|uniref:PTS sugar transporter subunit IIA n=1 Tax=Alteribacillus sp. YIM 98480 TaxID=2606599 RepID=UPI00131DAE4F|nr:PTS sugar transporter subunit IIA [Alteribacillus sp. YIM 98480]